MLYKVSSIKTSRTKRKSLMAKVAISPVTEDGEIKPAVSAFLFENVWKLRQNDIASMNIRENSKGYPIISEFVKVN